MQAVQTNMRRRAVRGRFDLMIYMFVSRPQALARIAAIVVIMHRPSILSTDGFLSSGKFIFGVYQPIILAAF